MTKLAKILRDNPGATLLLDNDCFWVVKVMDDDSEEHWSDIPGNELYRGDSQPGHDLLAAAAEVLNLKVEHV